MTDNTIVDLFLSARWILGDATALQGDDRPFSYEACQHLKWAAGTTHISQSLFQVFLFRLVQISNLSRIKYFTDFSVEAWERR